MQNIARYVHKLVNGTALAIAEALYKELDTIFSLGSYLCWVRL